MLHGNGGARARFQLFAERLREKDADLVDLHLPALPGFEGRPLDDVEAYWDQFLAPLIQTVEKDPSADWVLYGHGIGGSMLLEWAARGWTLSDGSSFQPRLVIMHSIIGASLQARWFPKVMRFKWMRHLIHQLIYAPSLRPRWERRLFLEPDKIPQALKDRFFEDYKYCAAFPVLFDLITPGWYAQVQAKLDQADFYFLWGGKERVVAADYLSYWRRDFPNSQFTTIPDWDHFPMLEQNEAFYKTIMTLILPNEQA